MFAWPSVPSNLIKKTVTCPFDRPQGHLQIQSSNERGLVSFQQHLQQLAEKYKETFYIYWLKTFELIKTAT